MRIIPVSAAATRVCMRVLRMQRVTLFVVVNVMCVESLVSALCQGCLDLAKSCLCTGTHEVTPFVGDLARLLLPAGRRFWDSGETEHCLIFVRQAFIFPVRCSRLLWSSHLEELEVLQSVMHMGMSFCIVKGNPSLRPKALSLDGFLDCTEHFCMEDYRGSFAWRVCLQALEESKMCCCTLTSQACSALYKKITVAFVLQSMGLQAVLHFSSLVPLLLEMARSRHKDIRLSSLAALGSLVQATWPRMKHHLPPICAVLAEVHTFFQHLFSVC